MGSFDQPHRHTSDNRVILHHVAGLAGLTEQTETTHRAAPFPGGLLLRKTNHGGAEHSWGSGARIAKLGDLLGRFQGKFVVIPSTPSQASKCLSSAWSAV